MSLLTGRLGPLLGPDNSPSSEALGTETARLAYLLYLSRSWGFAAGILRGKMPRDAMDTWRARVRASIDSDTPLAMAIRLFERLGVEWDAARLEDRRWLRIWHDEMRTAEPADGDRRRAEGLYWPAMQDNTVVSEALLGADLLSDWLKQIKTPDAPPSDDDAETIAMLSPRQRLAAGLPL